MNIQKYYYAVFVKVHGVDTPYKFVDSEGGSDDGLTVYRQIGGDIRVGNLSNGTYIPHHAIEYIVVNIYTQPIDWHDELCEEQVDTNPHITLMCPVIDVGNGFPFEYDVYPPNAEITWESSSPDVTVNEIGVVSLETNKATETTITATITVDGYDYSDSCDITVTPIL